MTFVQGVLGVVTGFAAGVMSGAFGVGGGIITTPAVQVLLGGTPLQAIATPLPVIFPTAVAGAARYHRAGESSVRAAWWAGPPGAAGAAIGAVLVSARLFDARALLLVTAVLIGWQAWRVGLAKQTQERPRGSTPGWQYALAGAAAGFVSGLLGVGGGIIFVPLLVTVLGMPLKRALGTSLLVIPAFVVPATIVYAINGHIAWSMFLVLAVGVVPGARIGAALALRATDRTLRVAVSVFLMAVALSYGSLQAVDLLRTR